MSELDGQIDTAARYGQEMRKVIWVKVGDKPYSVGDERTPGIVLTAIGVASAPVRVVELKWSDGINDTILPCISDRLVFRHERVEPSLIEIPRLDTTGIMP